MRFVKPIVLCGLLGLTLGGCKNESVSPQPYSYDYFPLEFGRYVIYDVDSVFHSDNDNNNDDSVYSWHFQVKERIDSTFIDGQGRPAQRVLRYRRLSASDPWTFMNVWTQTRTAAAAYRNEDNVVYHRLSVPPHPGVSWNGNDSNTLEEEYYSYDGIDQPMTVGAVLFDSTLAVNQRDDDNFVEKIYGYEVYANGVGMVFRQRDNLRKQNGSVVYGTEYKMTVNAFGVE
jgi:hypothetical protein